MKFKAKIMIIAGHIWIAMKFIGKWSWIIMKFIGKWSWIATKAYLRFVVKWFPIVARKVYIGSKVFFRWYMKVVGKIYKKMEKRMK